MALYASTPKRIEVIDLLNQLRASQLGEDKSSIVDRPNKVFNEAEKYLSDTFLYSVDKIEELKSELPPIPDTPFVPPLNQLPPGFGGFTEKGLEQEVEKFTDDTEQTPIDVDAPTTSSDTVSDTISIGEREAEISAKKVTEGLMSSPRPKPRPTQDKDDDIVKFIKDLTLSESSGDSTADRTNEDGRRFAGLLQFGKARLTDYKEATNTKFTQDQFVKDVSLQEKVALWHIKDIDKLIDKTKNKGKYTNRNGLRAVAHLGGKTGMTEFVETQGKYNPADEEGTTLQEYYDKFKD